MGLFRRSDKFEVGQDPCWLLLPLRYVSGCLLIECEGDEAKSFIYNYFTEKGRPQKDMTDQWKKSVCDQKPVLAIKHVLEAVELNDWCWKLPKLAFDKVRPLIIYGKNFDIKFRF